MLVSKLLSFLILYRSCYYGIYCLVDKLFLRDCRRRFCIPIIIILETLDWINIIDRGRLGRCWPSLLNNRYLLISLIFRPKHLLQTPAHLREKHLIFVSIIISLIILWFIVDGVRSFYPTDQITDLRYLFLQCLVIGMFVLCLSIVFYVTFMFWVNQWHSSSYLLWTCLKSLRVFSIYILFHIERLIQYELLSLLFL